MHARQIGPLNLGAKPYVRKKSQIVFVGAGYRVLLAATDSNQVHAADTSATRPHGFQPVLSLEFTSLGSRFYGHVNYEIAK